ncbi:GHKL domain-containing protein [Anaerosporobacter sp.]|uniref:GHKL domain-containing protein n=1 Tax=Anaerosporobacter sp. TaxID=1872529 RepID=UPI00286F7B7A|nr:GHKL domain-containing protein [Anaerosporobacter sp.]
MDSINYTLITGILDIVLSAIILKIYFGIFFVSKEKRKVELYIPWIIYFVWQVFLSVDSNVPAYAKLLISTLLIIVIGLTRYSGNFELKLIYAILICVIWTMMEFVVGCFFSLLNIDYILLQLEGAIISKLFTLVLIIIIRCVLRNENIQHLSKEYTVLLLLIPVGSMFVIYNIFSLTVNINKTQRQIYTSLQGLLIMLLINVLIFKVIIKLSEESELRRENTVYAQQLELCNIHMKEKESVMQESRNARHDLKYHFIVMMKMIEMKEIDKLDIYLSKLIKENKYEKLGIARTDNIVVDALVNAKFFYAQENEISFEVHLNIPTQLPFENADISILLGNILDNAFEASIQLPVARRHVELIMKLEKNALIIVLKNAYNGVVLKDKNGKPMTTKKDSVNHGLGLKSVVRIAEKYCGSVLLNEENGFFVMKILLCNV